MIGIRFVLGCTFLCGALLAQNPDATITGAVADGSGAAIPGASVVITGVDTGVSFRAETNSAGVYRISSLVPGTYRALVSKDGFQTAVQEKVEVHVGDSVSLNYTLQLGSVKETVNVEGSAMVLDTNTTTVGQVIEDRQIEDMPLNGRNVMNLLELVPGVVPQGATSGNVLNNQGAIGNYTNPAGWANYQIGGGIAGQNAEYVDGAPINLPQQNWVGLVPVQDAIREFRVDSNNISPEYGRYYGGVVNFSTKSGTNQFHGTLYEYFRNTLLNANNFFNNRAGVVRPPLNQNQYGAAIGGPVIKNKAFFFANWEGFSNRSGIPFAARVPTAAERVGDFTAYAPIYYTGTTTQISCNGVLNKVCPDPVSNYIANVYKYWTLPNFPNPGPTGINFVTNAASGSDSNQVTIRGDYNLGKHQLFSRYSYWNTDTLGTNWYHTQNNVTSPEVLSTSNQAVLGDTYTISPTTIADVRLSYLRFPFQSKPTALGKVDLTQFGPGLAAIANQVTWDVLPIPNLSGYNVTPYPVSPALLNVLQFFTYDTYYLAGNITKVIGKHTVRFGGTARNIQSYMSPGGSAGTYTFLPTTPTSNEFANFLLGTPVALTSTIATGHGVENVELYGGVYVNDTWNVTHKLTVNAGVRWELPSGEEEKHDRNTVLLPNTASPLGSIRNPVTGATQNLVGDLALVNSPQYSSRYDNTFHKDLFAPSVGVAYRILPGTVIRTGYGIAYLPFDINAPSPSGSPINSATTPVTGTLDNPFPQINNVLPQPIGRNPAFINAIQGLAISGRVPTSPYPYVQQWNFNIQQELGKDSILQVGYVGSKGTHIELSWNLNALPDSVAAQAATQYQALVASGLSTTAADAQTLPNVKVANPLAGLLASGSAYNTATISQGQLLRPFPQFANVTNQAFNAATSNFNSLQASYRKRFHAAGTFMVTYAWSKLLGTADSTTGYLESSGVGGYQDPNNLSAQYALASFNVPQRVVLNYSLALPVGKGQRWLPNAGPAASRVISGWSLSSITTFQNGYPLVLTAQPNDLSNSFGFGAIRPNVVSGCSKSISGSAQSRLNEWFNTACFVQPPTPFSLGNESRTDPQLRTAGISNWDVGAVKDTSINERFHLLFTAQFLNLFNRVQFGQPGVQVGSAYFGQVTTQINNPRQIQFALRLSF